MAVDGSLKFDTKIDTSGFEKGTEQITKSAKAQAATLAAIYRKQGMSQSDAFKKTWAETERTAKTSTTKVKSDIAGIGNQATKSAKSIGGTLTGSLKKLISVATIAFLGSQIIQFSKASIQASNDIENAMIGLKSIVEGQGRDFSQANKFIQEYTSDGLIPATEAVTAYKNLAMRGYTDPQIQSTLTALKDSAAFGRQASLTMGQAVKSASEGLKNENSILVDNAGVTKNVSMMWKDYAKSIGVGVESLTKEQKIQAEVNGILEETRFQTGDAAKVSETYSGKVLQLQFGLNNLKIAFGNFIKPIIAVIIPALNAAIGVFTRFFNTLAQISSALFGVKTDSAKQSQKQADAVGDTVKNEKDLAKATDKASKAAKSQLAGFDELQVLSKQAADSASGGDGGGGTITPPTIGSENSEIGGNVEISPKIAQAIEKIKEIFKSVQIWFDTTFSDTFATAFGNIGTEIDQFKDTLECMFSDIGTLAQPLIDWFNGDFTVLMQTYVTCLGTVITGLFDSFNKVFSDIWNIVLMPFAENLVTVMLPFWAQLSTECFETLTTLFTEIKNIFDMLWSEGVAPGLEAVVKIWSEAWDSMKVFWDTYGKPIFDSVRTAIEKTGELFKILWENFLYPIWLNILEAIDFIWTSGLKPLLDNILGFVGELITAALDIYNGFIAPIVGWLVEVLGPVFTTVINVIINVFSTLFVIISNVAGGIIKVFTGVIEFFKGVFTGDIKTAFEGVVKIFSGAFEAIWGIVKGVVNLIIDALNFLLKGLASIISSIVNAVIGGINALVAGILVPINLLLDAINLIPGMKIPKLEFAIPKVPDFGQALPSIPKLARGAVIPPNKQFMAVLGDQKSGTNIEAPLDTIVSAVKMAIGENNNGGELVIKFTGAMSELVRILKPELDKESSRKGARLVMG